MFFNHFVPFQGFDMQHFPKRCSAMEGNLMVHSASLSSEQSCCWWIQIGFVSHQVALTLTEPILIIYIISVVAVLISYMDDFLLGFSIGASTSPSLSFYN